MADQTISEPAKELGRIAYLITVLCALAVGLVFETNSDRVNTEAARGEARDWFYNVEGMVKRSRDYAARSAEFYGALIAEMIRSKRCGATGLPDCKSQSLPTDEDSWFATKTENTSSDKWARLGEAVKLALSRSRDRDQIPEVLKVLEAQLTPAARTRIIEPDIGLLIELTSERGWPLAPRWILYREVQGGTYYDQQGFPQATFRSYPEPTADSRLRVLLLRVLGVQNESATDQILVAELGSALSNIEKFSRSDSRIAILGSDLKFDGAIAIVVIMIVVSGLQLLYVTLFRLGHDGGWSHAPWPRFPDFGRFSKSQIGEPIASALCSTLWWGFALLPPTILTVGAISRYVMFQSVGTARGDVTVALFPMLSFDALSVTLDYLSAVSLIVVLLLLVSLEKLLVGKSATRPVALTMATIFIVLAIVGALVLLLRRDVTWMTPPYACLPRSVAVLAWPCVLGWAYWWRRWDLWAVTAVVSVLVGSLAYRDVLLSSA